MEADAPAENYDMIDDTIEGYSVYVDLYRTGLYVEYGLSGAQAPSP